MKIIKPSVEFYGAVPTDYTGALKFIEMAGRTCYKSEDRITDESAEPFVRRLIKSGHLAMVEHSNFVVRRKRTGNFDFSMAIIDAGKYLTVRRDKTYIYVGGSITAWVQRFLYLSLPYDETMFAPFIDRFGDLFDEDSDQFMSAFTEVTGEGWAPCPHDEIPKELHRYSAKFICDRGVSHELVRHRPCSFAQESTRFVNYAGKELEFIEPEGFEEWPRAAREEFNYHCKQSENVYSVMLRRGLKPQQARAVLPNALKTEIVVTADAAEWRHIRKLRTAKDAHPDMQRVMNMMPWEDFL